MRLITYFFRKIFGIVKNEFYLIFPDNTIKKIGIKVIPGSVILRKNPSEIYYVSNTSMEIIDDTLIRVWIRLEK